jgi:hypothetical protein
MAEPIHLQAVAEPCGVPGGVQLTLMPWAVIGLIVYSAGYPTFVFINLYRNRELAMEDQLLRAKGTGNDELTNPNAYRFRKAFGRSYYQFKARGVVGICVGYVFPSCTSSSDLCAPPLSGTQPDYVIWILCIIARKFSIAGESELESV